MKAVFIESFSGVDGLAVKDVELPKRNRPTDVLVRVRAAGLNRADLLQARGGYPPPPGVSPNVPGLEFAGEIVELDSGATPAWKVGDRVMGITSGAAQAEYVTSPAELLMRVPEVLNFVKAACIPEAFITAHDAIFTIGHLQRNETLLIHAVGSGVGLAALQLAKAIGATVVGTSRTAFKLDACKEFGLSTAILSRQGFDLVEDLRSAGHHGVDVILDLVGAANLTSNLSALGNKGRLVLVGLTSGSKGEIDLGLLLRKRASMIGTVLRPRSLEEKASAVSIFAKDFLPLFADGRLLPNLDKIVPLLSVRDAYSYLASNQSFGKVVIEF